MRPRRSQARLERALRALELPLLEGPVTSDLLPELLGVATERAGVRICAELVAAGHLERLGRGCRGERVAFVLKGGPPGSAQERGAKGGPQGGQERGVTGGSQGGQPGEIEPPLSRLSPVGGEGGASRYVAPLARCLSSEFESERGVASSGETARKGGHRGVAERGLEANWQRGVKGGSQGVVSLWKVAEALAAQVARLEGVVDGLLRERSELRAIAERDVQRDLKPENVLAELAPEAREESAAVADPEAVTRLEAIERGAGRSEGQVRQDSLAAQLLPWRLVRAAVQTTVLVHHKKGLSDTPAFLWSVIRGTTPREPGSDEPWDVHDREVGKLRAARRESEDAAERARAAEEKAERERDAKVAAARERLERERERDRSQAAGLAAEAARLREAKKPKTATANAGGAP